MATNNDSVIDDLGADHKAIAENVGPVGRALLTALDRAVSMQASSIENYVNYLRRRNPDASPAQIQKILDNHFSRLATGSGASVGAAAAIPGIGFLTGSAAVAGESIVFLDAAAFYTVASAYVRGVDIHDPERRRALVLLVLLGAKGIAVVDVLVGDLADPKNPLAAARALGSFSGPKLATVNNRLMRMAMRRVTKRLMRGWIGKIMPLGIGAVAGTIANRRLAGEITQNMRESLGDTPQAFANDVPPAPAKDKSVQADGKDAQQGNVVSRLLARIRPGKNSDSLTGDEADDQKLDQMALDAMAQAHADADKNAAADQAARELDDTDGSSSNAS
ncbi:hypothetical protein [Corynebacterium tapiri]|uniref:hypothetical protein n=1 Tax=Corynebacterium tapiri TaxID=1448266 RepID=UPI0015D628A5|nr:hypothetical protein [Corynebacterium tapiri]